MKDKKIVFNAGKFDAIDLLPCIRLYLDYGHLFIEIAWLSFYAYAGVKLYDGFNNGKKTLWT